jgi:hypothetical protein
MALKRYIGPEDEVRLVVAGNEIGVVSQGGSIVVPDDVAESVGWAEEFWEDGSKAQEKKMTRAEEKAVKKAGSENPEVTDADSAPGKDAE